MSCLSYEKRKRRLSDYANSKAHSILHLFRDWCIIYVFVDGPGRQASSVLACRQELVDLILITERWRGTCFTVDKSIEKFRYMTTISERIAWKGRFTQESQGRLS